MSRTLSQIFGFAVNVLCSLIFISVAMRLTATSHMSTYVLSIAPLAQGALIALPAIWALQAKRRNRPLAMSLSVGIIIQISVFCVWYERWVQTYVN